MLPSESATVARHTLKMVTLHPDEGRPRADALALRARFEERLERAPRVVTACRRSLER